MSGGIPAEKEKLYYLFRTADIQDAQVNFQWVLGMKAPSMKP